MPPQHTPTDAARVSISKVEHDSLLRDSRHYRLLKQSLFQAGLTRQSLALLLSAAPGHTTAATPYHRSSAGIPASPPPPPQPEIDEADSLDHDHHDRPLTATHNRPTLRTLYFSRLSPNTTYRDLLSVIKGGRLLDINMPSERSAMATLAHGAADYLAWAKRNDIYLHSKRVEVKWAEHQYKLNDHISNKLANGATRNILIRSAVDRGLTEERIRGDLEHIHNLTIIHLTFQNGHAYVSTNSVHNALFARTCMMSRTAYRRCKIEFYPDECNVPLPCRPRLPQSMPETPIGKKKPMSNRFNMLRIDDDSDGSNEENRESHDTAQSDSDPDEDDTTSMSSPHGVSLRSLDDEDSLI